MLLNCTYLIAQERVVTGKVKDPSGNPLPGVNVNVFGTRISVTADVTGTFRIPVSSPNSVLVFSFVGFLQQEQKVGNDSTFNISMAYDNADLDQVVVVGYGTSKRRDLTGSVYSIKPGMVTATPVSNAAEALQGRIPGLDINRTSGAPGGGVSIQLRGNRTLNGTNNGVAGSSSEPLIIIDGFQGGSISDLNPNDIESVEVLKDASATAIYGWQGANGVIIITTKRGKDRPKVSYAGFYGVNDVNYPKVRMGQDFINFRKEAWRGANPNDPNVPTDEAVLDKYELPYYQAGKWVDWLDLITRNGIEQSHTASIQSGGDKTKVYFSAGVYRQEGVLRGTDNTRYNTRLNYDQRISNMFKAGFMTQLTYQTTNGRIDPMSQVNNMVPFGDVYDSLGNIKLFPMIPSNEPDPKNKNFLNPLTDERGAAYIDNTQRGNLIANGYLEITPITGLSVRSNLGTTLGYSRRGEFYDSVTLQNYNKPANGSTAKITNEFTRFYNWDNIVTYTRRFNDHNITLTGLTNYTHSEREVSDVTGLRQTLVNWQFYNLDGTQTTTRQTTSNYFKTTTFSYAGRLNYTFKGKYLLTATMRADGVSRLSKDKKWDYFPSAGIGWNIHQEDFMRDAWFVNNLKIRATYGEAGNASMQAYGTQSVLATGNAILGNTPITVASFDKVAGNLNVGWEKTATTNVGLDFALFKSRFYGTIDAYKSKTTDILFLRPLPLSSGFTHMWQNLGSSENEGIELALSSVNMNRGNFRWTTTLTFTSAREKLTHLITSQDIIDKEDNSLMVNHPVKSWFGYNKIGIWQKDENKDGTVKFGNYIYQEGDIKVEDKNGDNVIDPINDRGFVGADVPKWYGGLQNTFNYKGFELSVYLVARYGQIINADFMAARYNVGGDRNGLADFNYWTPENPTNEFPRPRQGASFSNAGYTGYYSLNFVDGSFFKVKTATFAYTLPTQTSRRVFADRIRLYVTGNNIWTKTKNKMLKNYDPERGGSENTPLTRQFVFGANIDF
ncbi:SusC/RagA family TonB-linked outer membrane protein [Longitalea luteola]|uniref:SusC/RagA family TonB-linked outer membrane protein n=1 Tax=Longitalea luteola TaxID=2812563 RepID=UPI001A9692EE|nr:TonB-dependent receptor [Longitalea luteola]